MPLIIVALIVALAGGVGTVYASQDARPGDALYGVHAAIEHVAGPGNGAKAGQNNLSGKQGNRRAGEDRDATTSVITGTLGITLTKTISDVNTTADDLPGNSENGLYAKLRAVEKSLTRDKGASAQHQLGAFLHQVDAACHSGKISDAQYNTLYGDYSQLTVALGVEAETAVAPCGTGKADAAVDDGEEGQAAPGKADGRRGKSDSTKERGKSDAAKERGKPGVDQVRGKSDQHRNDQGRANDGGGKGSAVGRPE